MLSGSKIVLGLMDTATLTSRLVLDGRNLLVLQHERCFVPHSSSQMTSRHLTCLSVGGVQLRARWKAFTKGDKDINVGAVDEEEEEEEAIGSSSRAVIKKRKRRNMQNA